MIERNPMNLKASSTTALVTKLRQLETLGRATRDSLEALRLFSDWRAIRNELDSRPGDAVLTALHH
jgi:hypothetical protein